MKQIQLTKTEENRPSWIKTQMLALSLLLSTGTQVTSADIELAIKGYDPVAYFTMINAVKGSEEISYESLGYKWLFSNRDHKALFMADPMRYMPNYGGYCSYDPVTLGHDHKVDPTAWRIVDEKLYLFYSDAKAAHAMPTEKWEKVKAGLSQ